MLLPDKKPHVCVCYILTASFDRKTTWTM